MNVFVEKMIKHASVREFKETPLSASLKKDLITAAQSGSSSNFVQAFSIIDITDNQLKNDLAELTNSADYVKKTGAFYIFVADLYRQANILSEAGQSLDGIKTMESLLVATIDTTIAAQNMVVAAEAMDLGICFIGGIRNNLEKVSRLLELPPYTVPLYGLTLGIPVHTKNEVKPKRPQQTVVSQNHYDKASFTDLAAYDQIIQTYYQQRSTNKQEATWTEKNRLFFKDVRRKDVGAFLKKQGFSLD